MNSLQDNEVAFFGKITAGITHEMKNVLAIIKESSGLMEDILSLSPDALVSYQEKLEKSLNKIKNQIQRGVELTDLLNKFAHTPDETIGKIDLYESFEQLVALSQRFARIKNVILKAAAPKQSDDQTTLVTRPVQWQMALFTAIECCLNAMPAGGEIHIDFAKGPGKYTVHILCTGDLPALTEFSSGLTAFEKWPILQNISAVLQGSAQLDESAHGILISIPEEITV